MKRMIALLLAIFMVVGMFPTTVQAAETDPTISFSTTFADTMTVGDTFAVTASIANNPGIALMTLSLKWNEDVVKFTGFDKYEDDFPVSEVFEARGWTATANHELGIIVANRTTNSTDDGTLFTANFEIVGYGEANIGLKQGDETEYDVRNENSIILSPVLDFSALEGMTVASSEEPECEHTYVAGICTLCKEADPDYVAPSVTGILSLSRDAAYMTGAETGEIMAFKDITVPYFDLGLYGLEEYYFVSESYGSDGSGGPGNDLEPGTAAYADGKVTMLHLLIYALEVYYYGVDEADAGKGYLYDQGLIGGDAFTIQGDGGSAYMTQFWGGDCNLNYYVNYEYPLASDGVGSTVDQILLRDGDLMTVGHFSSWDFYQDPYSIFNYIVADNDNPTEGDEITLKLYYAGADLGATGGTAQNENNRELDVYYVPAGRITSADVTAWTKLGTTDANGELVVDTADLGAGKYIVAVAGQYGEYYPDAICSTPGGLQLTIASCSHTNWNEATCTTPKTCAQCGEIEGEVNPDAHNYVDGVCEYCKAEVTVESNDATVWSGEVALSGSADVTITELLLKDAKDKVLASYMGDYAGTYPLYVFLDGDKAAVGDTFVFDFVAEGDDKDKAEFRLISNYFENEYTIQSYGYDMGTMQIQETASWGNVSFGVKLALLTKFALNDETLTLTTGNEGTLSVSTNSGDITSWLKPIVEWTTSDANVATVDGGKVTAVAPGTAIITAKVGDKTASCTVTVESNDVVIYSSETGMVMPGSYDIAVTEVVVKNAKDKVFIVDDTDRNDTSSFPAIYPVIFLNEDVAVGDVFELDYKAIGADAANAKMESDTFKIQSYLGVQGSMKVRSPDYYSVDIFPAFWVINKFALNNSELTLTTGEESTLALSTNQQQYVTNKLVKFIEWSTSDESVVTVDGGKVTAVALGEATITAKVGDKTATCEVTVACDHDYFNGVCTKCEEVDDAYVAITEIALDSYSTETVTDETGAEKKILSLKKGATELMEVTLNEGATQGFSWSTSDESVATVDQDGVITAVGAGTATITVTAGDVVTFAAENTPVTASVEVTVTDVAEGYTLTMPADMSVTAGETVNIPVTLGSTSGAAYNAFDITVSYPEGLTLTSTEFDGLEVTAGEGTIRIKAYGEAREAGSVPFILTFKANAIGEYPIEVTTAKVDNSTGAMGSDAPEAERIDGVTVVTITGYNVTLPDGFTGETVAAPGEDYSFSVPQDNFDYTVTVTVGGEPVEVTDEDGDGTYTIPGSEVDGEIVITETSAPKTFEVTLGEDMTGEETATFGTDYSATLTSDENYSYKVEITIGGKDYTGYSVSGNTWTIPGGDITGEIEFVVTKTKIDQGGEGGATQHAITFQGSGAGAAADCETKVSNGSDYILTLDKELGYDYTVTANVKNEDGTAGAAVEVTANEDGTYTIAAVRADLIITVERTMNCEVSIHNYVNLDDKTMFLVLVDGEHEDGKHYAYDGKAMYYSFDYEAYAYLTVEEGEFTKEIAAAKVTIADGNKMTIRSQYDVNRTDLVDINDAQLVYDIYNGKYDEVADLGMVKFLYADVNVSMNVTVEDAAAVVANIK